MTRPFISGGVAQHLLGPGANFAVYDARSIVAHSGSSAPEGALNDTYELVKRLIDKMINSNHVPTSDEIEGEFFGSDE